jgi:hypothetical protein
MCEEAASRTGLRGGAMREVGLAIAVICVVFVGVFIWYRLWTAALVRSGRMFKTHDGRVYDMSLLRGGQAIVWLKYTPTGYHPLPEIAEGPMYEPWQLDRRDKNYNPRPCS